MIYLQPTLEIFATLHEIFDIINVWEVNLEGLEKLSLSLRQICVGEEAEKGMTNRDKA